MLGYWTAGPEDPIDLVLEAERLGYESVWTAEAYGSDAVSPLCWLGARTTRIKLGTAVLQISERTREFVALVRAMLRREGPVTFQGRHYQLPYPGGSGLGKPLKLIGQPLRTEVPIYLGAMGPKNIALAREIADGWLPLYMSPYRMREVYGTLLDGLRPGFEVACPVQVVMGDDLAQCLVPVKTTLAFYIGGMGHRTKNFSKEQIARLGYAEAAERVQRLFIEGRRGEAIETVPDALADEIALCGPPPPIRERLRAWNETPVTTLVVMTRDPAVLRL